MEVLIESPISLTESAVNEIKNIISEKQIPADYGLRVGVKGGGCSGLSYILGFDLQKENDNVYQVGDIQIIMEKSHGMYLAGTTEVFHLIIQMQLKRVVAEQVLKPDIY